MGTVVVDGKNVTFDDKWSFGVFSSIEHLKDLPDGIIIYRTVFSSEIPDTVLFRDDLKNVTFLYCNLDNVIVPSNNIVSYCSQRRFKVQNDLNDWLIDNNNDPIMPMNYKTFEKLNLPVPDPTDIPLQKVTDPVNHLEKAIKGGP